MNLKQFDNPKYNKIAVYVIITAVIIFILCTTLSLSGGFFRKLFNVIGLVLKPIIYGGIIAYIFEPLIQMVEKLFHGKSARLIAVILTAALVLAVFIGGIFMIGIAARNRAGSITIDTGSVSAIIKSLDVQINEIIAKVQNWLTENLGVIGNTFGKITNIFSGFSDFASNFFFSLIFAVYFLLDSERLGAYWSRILDIFVKPEFRERARELISDADRCFSGYIRGKLLDALLVFLMISAAMLICRIPYAFVIGLMTALGNLIPFVGPVGGIITLLVVCLSEGLMSEFVIGAVVLVVLMAIDANVINPKLMSRSIAIHPLLVFAAMIAGGAVGGIAGMLVSAPLAAFLKIEFDKYVDRKEAECRTQTSISA